MECKHGLPDTEVCWLCKGGKQEQEEGFGAPGWYSSSTQQAIRHNFGVCKGRVFELDNIQGIPKGRESTTIDRDTSKTSLPYRRKGGPDPKQRKRYESQRAKKG